MSQSLANINQYAVAAIVIFITIAGDYAIKEATMSQGGRLLLLLAVGACMYGISAFGWFLLMKSSSLSNVAILYSATTLLLLSAIGWMFFNEGMDAKKLLGLALAVVSIIIVNE